MERDDFAISGPEVSCAWQKPNGARARSPAHEHGQESTNHVSKRLRLHTAQPRTLLTIQRDQKTSLGPSYVQYFSRLVTARTHDNNGKAVCHHLLLALRSTRPDTARAHSSDIP